MCFILFFWHSGGAGGSHSYSRRFYMIVVSKVSLEVGIPKTIDWMRDVYVHKKPLVNLDSYL